MHRLMLVSLFLFVSTLPNDASAMRVIDFSEFSLPGNGAIAVPVAEAATLTGVAAAVNEATDGSLAQPGTRGFQGGPLCTRYENGKMFVLPGCRGPGDDGYDPAVDGTIDGLLHPFTAQQFSNEMAALSWNALMALVGLSTPGEGEAPNTTQFDVDNPFRAMGRIGEHAAQVLGHLIEDGAGALECLTPLLTDAPGIDSHAQEEN